MAIFVPSTDVDDIRIPNHAMIKKKTVMVAVCLGKEQLNPRIYRG